LRGQTHLPTFLSRASNLLSQPPRRAFCAAPDFRMAVQFQIMNRMMGIVRLLLRNGSQLGIPKSTWPHSTRIAGIPIYVLISVRDYLICP
jgi:hypothetical protein